MKRYQFSHNSCHSFYCHNGMTMKAQVVDLWRLNTRGTWTLYKVQWAPHYVYGSHPWGFMSSIFSTIIAFPNIYTFHLLLFSSRHNDFICSPHWNIWVLICNLLQELQFQRIYITSHKRLEFPQGWGGGFVIPKSLNKCTRSIIQFFRGVRVLVAMCSHTHPPEGNVFPFGGGDGYGYM